jgi:hypothetical protein
VQLAANAPLAIDLHRFWTAEPRELDCGAVICNGEGKADDLGWELDLTLPLTVGRNQRLQLGYSAFRNGEAAPLVGLGPVAEWWHWGYAMLTFSFGAGLN